MTAAVVGADAVHEEGLAPGSRVVSPAVAAAPIPSSWKPRASAGVTSPPSRRAPVTRTVPAARVASAHADPVVV